MGFIAKKFKIIFNFKNSVHKINIVVVRMQFKIVFFLI
jgi:hypothetical protein